MSPQTPSSSLPEGQHAWGHGLATVTDDGTVLDTWFPSPALGEASGEAVPEALSALAGKDPERRVYTDVVTVDVDLAAAPEDASDVYLRLHLLSHRLVRPHGLNLDGVFAKLANVVWTNHGPCAVTEFEQVRLALRARGPVQVFGVDKFPRMTDYVLPTGVRVADADRVRLGAHLAAGTTVIAVLVERVAREIQVRGLTAPADVWVSDWASTSATPSISDTAIRLARKGSAVK